MISFKLKTKLFFKNLFKKIILIDLEPYMGLFVFIFLLAFSIIWWRALILGVFGYFLYIRLEKTLFRIASRK
jgi:hypothetical protein